jgi:hypothetical protein
LVILLLSLGTIVESQSWKENKMGHPVVKAAICTLLLAFMQAGGIAQTAQAYRTEVTGSMSDDRSYSPRLRPAYKKAGPQVLLDEGHQNASWNEGFFRLATKDGYRVHRSNEKLTADRLRNVTILVIMNPGDDGAVQSPLSPPAAFTEDEAVAVREWIYNGGALLYAFDVFANRTDPLLAKLGVEFDHGNLTDLQSQRSDLSSVFSGENLLSSHKIITGRSPEEQVKSVVMGGIRAIGEKPQDAVSLVFCSEAATISPDFLETLRRKEAAKAIPVKQTGQPENAPAHNVPVGIVPAPHAPIAVAFSLGKGRVVVLGNSGALEARIFHSAEGASPQAIGLTEADNQQFALNVIHWLSRLTE